METKFGPEQIFYSQIIVVS